MQHAYNQQFCEKLYFTVHYGTKLYSTVQYINISVILSSEISFLAPKTMEKTYNIPILNILWKNVLFSVLYSTVLYRTLKKW